MTRDPRFTTEICLAAQHAERETGCPAAITLAQWALESTYGKHTVGKYNCFGIKWYPKCGFPYIDAGTSEEVNGKEYETIAKFIDFPSQESAFSYHGRLVINGRPYRQAAAALARTGNWRQFLSAMARVYATDSHYEQKLLEIIDENHLADFNLPKPAV